MQTELKQPMNAGRSKKSFGLNLDLDYRFFNQTSSGCQTNRTWHPTPIPFRKHEKETLSLRLKFFRSAVRADYTQKENKTAWEALIADVTEFATKHFLTVSGFKRNDVIPYSDATNEAAYGAAEEAMIELRGIVARRTGKNGIAKTAHKPTPPFPNLCIPVGPVVYVMKDGVIDGKHHCKIGFTDNPVETRLAQLRTGNSRLQIETVLNAIPPISEKAVQDLFAHKRESKDLEWFNLDDAELSTLKNPERIRQMILDAA